MEFVPNSGPNKLSILTKNEIVEVQIEHKEPKDFSIKLFTH